MSHDTASNGSPFEVKVESIRLVADGVAEIVLVHPAGDALPTWDPGSHLDLHLPNGLVRQYSLISDPSETGHYKVAVLREKAGRGGSEYVHAELKTGAVLTCSAPRNNFRFHPAKAYRFIAGGIGITPLLQMIAAAERSALPWTLSYFGRSAASMAWAEDLRTRYPDRVQVRPDDVFGLPDVAATLSDLADGELIYACGPQGLLDALAAHLDDSTRSSLHLERFAPADPEALTADRRPFTVTLDRSGLELEVPADKSILDVMEEHGIPVISSCREGTCGTCETAVLAGSVEHRDSILSEEEKASNDTMMICCSRGIGTDLVIDA